jgi:hypothetical protein
MKMETKKILTICVFAFVVVVFCWVQVGLGEPMGTTFTYQARLMDKNKPADGLYSFQFNLYDSNDPCTGIQLGSPIDINDLDVIDGHFAVELDFGVGIFDGNAVWLETSVVASPMGSDPATLSPLLELTPTPYALYAETAGNVTVAGGDNDWIIDGDDIYSALSGNVGIGDSIPEYRLDVAGHINSTETYKLDGRTVLSNKGAFNIFVGYDAGYFNTTGQQNVAVGNRALYSNTTGSANTAVGYGALLDCNEGIYNSALGYGSLISNTTGQHNSAVGSHALHDNTTGNYNSAMGSGALYFNTTGSYNTAVGYRALYDSNEGVKNSAVGYSSLNSNTTGQYNSAVGSDALHSNTEGNYNSAMGSGALLFNTTGEYNSAMGMSALRKNTTGSYNSAIGSYALYSNTTGTNNSAMGRNTLYYNTTGGYNSAVGSYTLHSNTTGNYNTAVGHYALFENDGGLYNSAVGTTALYSNTTGSGNVAFGSYANLFNEEGSNNTIIGYQAGRGTGVHNKSGNVFIGYQAGYYETDSNTLYIENSDSSSPLIYGEFDNNILTINGDLGVGTVIPAYDLDVIGDIRATGSVYYGGTEGNTDASAYTKPDFVFEQGYEVMTIEQVEEYLQRENHLPWLTSAKQEKRENGDVIDMTRMAFETVETAENLQIQIIALNKQIELLKAEISTLKSEMK